MSGGGAGVSFGTRLACTGSSQPSAEQEPSQVTRLGADRASVVWPAEQVPRTRTPLRFLAVTAVDAKPQAEVHCYGRRVKRLVSHTHPGRHTPMAQLVAQDLPARIRAAVEDVDDTRDAYRLSLEVRDKLIVEAIDSGMTQKQVAAMAKVQKGRISAILSNSEADDE